MYNRYVPQPDGSYLRNRLQENLPEAEAPSTVPSKETITLENQITQNPISQNSKPHKQYHVHRNLPDSQNNVSSFLRNLIPSGFDTEDLLVVILLLLMGGNNENQNNALLTLALYLFL